MRYIATARKHIYALQSYSPPNNRAQTKAEFGAYLRYISNTCIMPYWVLPQADQMTNKIN